MDGDPSPQKGVDNPLWSLRPTGGVLKIRRPGERGVQRYWIRNCTSRLEKWPEAKWDFGAVDHEDQSYDIQLQLSFEEIEATATATEIGKEKERE